MSTRCNIVVKDECGELIFYRHSDGYPEGTLPTLKIFMKWVAEGYIRNNVGQAAGWLVMIGVNEYQIHVPDIDDEYDHPKDWKVGAYEPTSAIHGDIDYLYVLDLDELTIKVYSDNFTFYKRNTPDEIIICSHRIEVKSINA